MRPTSDRAPAQALLAVLLAAVAGCGGGSPPEPIDASKAREILGQALDAWARGEEPGALADRSPSTYVVDHDWQGAVRLDSYEFRGDGQALSHQWRGQVLLTQVGPDGKTRTRLANYAVATDPVTTIVRDED